MQSYKNNKKPTTIFLVCLMHILFFVFFVYFFMFLVQLYRVNHVFGFFVKTLFSSSISTFKATFLIKCENDENIDFSDFRHPKVLKYDWFYKQTSQPAFS